METVIGRDVGLRSLRATGVKRAVFRDDGSLQEVEFFLLQPTAPTEAEMTGSTMPIGLENGGMPTDDELLLWSSGGPLPDLNAKKPEGT